MLRPPIPPSFSLPFSKKGKLSFWLAFSDEVRVCTAPVSYTHLDVYKRQEICRLFDETAREVAGAFGFSYHAEEAKNSFAHFLHVIELPKDAQTVYGAL